MGFKALRNSPHVIRNAIQFPGYLLQLGKEKVQTEERKPVDLPASVKIVKKANGLIENVVLNLQLMFCDEEWIAQRALTTRIERLQELNDGIGEMIPGTAPLFLSAVSVDEAEVSKFNYPVELFSRIRNTASLTDHKITVRKA